MPKKYSIDLRWRAVFLVLIYCMTHLEASEYLFVSRPSVDNWLRRFEEIGDVCDFERTKRNRYSAEVLEWIEQYTYQFPDYYLHEIQRDIKVQFPNLRNVSVPTLCRAINKDLGLTRKVIETRAMERNAELRRAFIDDLKGMYVSDDQFIFIDEVARDGRDVRRRYGRSKRGTVVKKDTRGRCVQYHYSALAFFDKTGFLDWTLIKGTYDRELFHQAVMDKLIPLLNPHPMPRSIVVCDNAVIHRYPEFIEAVHSQGAEVLWLPPYSPDLNPIEAAFGIQKAWLRANEREFFRDPFGVMNASFRDCLYQHNMLRHCGYMPYHFDSEAIEI
eukprot:TRINITY_DN1313_c0_g1_i2.p1 TRINITY_DN1313_c0_g1~~TRINITY_DN1313_c0_g1_i2.p1  ORF type:complete len:330 (+),score=29.20 TRINITY_DN1313_c0_g1_i2:389-1378(+)